MGLLWRDLCSRRYATAKTSSLSEEEILLAKQLCFWRKPRVDTLPDTQNWSSSRMSFGL